MIVNDEFTITQGVGGVVEVRMPAHDAAVFAQVVDRFAELLERGLAGRGRLAWTGGVDGLFPPAYRSRRASREFRQRHAEGQRRVLLDAARRVERQLAVAVDFTLTPAQVSDWIMVCAHAQSMYVTERWTAKPLRRTFARDGLTWLMEVHGALADAALGHPSQWVTGGTS